MRGSEDTPEVEQENDESGDGPNSLEMIKTVLEVTLAVARLLGSL